MNSGYVSDCFGYKGAENSVPSLTRVTAGVPGTSPNSDFFNSYSGIPILSYGCRTEPGSVPCAGPFFDGGYFQKVSLVNNEPEFSVDSVKYYDHSHTTLWYKQNFMVSNMGSNTVIDSINYNSLNDKDRPYARDFPTYGSLFKIESVDQMLASSSNSNNVQDFSHLMPAEYLWRGQVLQQKALTIDSGTWSWTLGNTDRSAATYDQGALWSQVVYPDPYTGNMYVLSEGWGDFSYNAHKDGGYGAPGTGSYMCCRTASRTAYAISPKHARDKAVDIFGVWMDNWATAHLWTNYGGQNQQFYMEDVGDGYQQIRVVHSGKCLEVANYSTSDGADIVQMDCSGEANQAFKKEFNNGGYKLKIKHSGKYVDCAGQGTSDGTNIHQWSGWAGDNQIFYFTPVP